MMNRRSFIRRAGAAGIAIAGNLDRPFATAQSSIRLGPTVETSSGKVRGLTDGRVYSFKGIPYGASTEGAGRFMPPSKPVAWTGVRETVESGARAPQPLRIMIPEMGDALTGHGPASEDCLKLNVWTPKLDQTAKRPVMVWFHGGGMRTGWAGSIMYDGAELARKHGVVVVGVNHRLNVFGFLYLADAGGEKYANSSNVGALDLIAALAWVQENISSFGGDPGQVTIFGQSGGGGKVATVQAMPLAGGLFHRMIIQSTIRETALQGLPKQDAVMWADIFMRRLGLRPNKVDELQKQPVEKLIAALSAKDEAGDISLRFVPVVDGGTLPANPFDPTAPVQSASIPLMVGSVESESVPYANPSDPYWTTDEINSDGLRQRVKHVLGIGDAEADRIISVYKKDRPESSNMDLATILESDSGTLRQAGYTIAELKAKQGHAAAYLYYFQWNSPLRQGKVRCMHGMELPFVFDHVDAARFMTGTGQDRYVLAEKVSGAWAAFARSGDPNHKGLPTWLPFDADRRATMVLGNHCRCVNDPYKDERLAVKSVLDAQRQR